MQKKSKSNLYNKKKCYNLLENQELIYPKFYYRLLKTLRMLFDYYSIIKFRKNVHKLLIYEIKIPLEESFKTSIKDKDLIKILFLDESIFSLKSICSHVKNLKEIKLFQILFKNDLINLNDKIEKIKKILCNKLHNIHISFLRNNFSKHLKFYYDDNFNFIGINWHPNFDVDNINFNSMYKSKK